MEISVIMLNITSAKRQSETYKTLFTVQGKHMKLNISKIPHHFAPEATLEPRNDYRLPARC